MIMLAVRVMLLISLVFSGAIFGFFYAWVCSTMWGLDQLVPSAAIQAMNAMNASVRNAIFFPAFFLTPVVLLATALVCWRSGETGAAQACVAAGVIYGLGTFLPTDLVNVPMNEALAIVSSDDIAQNAQDIWSAYSSRWQGWNLTRTIASGIALLVLGFGILSVGNSQTRPTS